MGRTLGCVNGVCNCYLDQNILPYGTLCQSVKSCLSAYYCALGDTMVCEERAILKGKRLVFV
jgi:hypothetical protein